LDASTDWKIFHPILAHIDVKKRRSAAGRKPIAGDSRVGQDTGQISPKRCVATCRTKKGGQKHYDYKNHIHIDGGTKLIAAHTTTSTSAHVNHALETIFR